MTFCHGVTPMCPPGGTYSIGWHSHFPATDLACGRSPAAWGPHENTYTGPWIIPRPETRDPRPETRAEIQRYPRPPSDQ